MLDKSWITGRELKNNRGEPSLHGPAQELGTAANREQQILESSRLGRILVWSEQGKREGEREGEREGLVPAVMITH